jgi:DNA primase
MLDPSRNGTGATIVAPYSPRGRADGTVSFPVTVDELGSIAPGEFTLRSAAGLLERTGPAQWRRLLEERGRLPRRLLDGPP